MHRYGNGQISLADFKHPVGMNLKERNRWVKKAQTIPRPDPGGQNLPKPGGYQLLQGAWNPSFRPGFGTA